MRKSILCVAIAMTCSMALAACANESTDGLQVALPQFSGSYMAPSLAFTASATPTPTTSSGGAGGAVGNFDKGAIASLATKVIEPPKEDVWAGPFCKKYKAYWVFFDKKLSFNLPESSLTTGGASVKQALAMVKEMQPLAKDPSQKAWTTAAVAFYSQIDSGKPYYWFQASPYTDSSDSGEWVDTNNKADIKAYRDFSDFSLTYQAPMALCLKLR